MNKRAFELLSKLGVQPQELLPVGDITLTFFGKFVVQRRDMIESKRSAVVMAVCAGKSQWEAYS